MFIFEAVSKFAKRCSKIHRVPVCLLLRFPVAYISKEPFENNTPVCLASKLLNCYQHGCSSLCLFGCSVKHAGSEIPGPGIEPRPPTLGARSLKPLDCQGSLCFSLLKLLSLKFGKLLKKFQLQKFERTLFLLRRCHTFLQFWKRVKGRVLWNQDWWTWNQCSKCEFIWYFLQVFFIFSFLNKKFIQQLWNSRELGSINKEWYWISFWKFLEKQSLPR